MTLSDDDRAFALKGEPLVFKDICLIYPKKLNEIFAREVGIKKFYQYLNLVLGTKPSLNPEAQEFEGKREEVKQLNIIFEGLSPLEFLLFNYKADDENKILIQKAFQFFTKERVLFLEEKKEIIIGPIEDSHIINEQNYYDFRSIIQHLYWMPIDEVYEINSNDDERTRELKRKLQRGKEAVDKVKAKSKQDGDGTSIVDIIASLPIKVGSLNILNVWDLSYYAFYDQLKRYNLSEQYDTNVRAALAGAKIESKKLKHWIRNIEKIDE